MPDKSLRPPTRAQCACRRAPHCLCRHAGRSNLVPAKGEKAEYCAATVSIHLVVFTLPREPPLAAGGGIGPVSIGRRSLDAR